MAEESGKKQSKQKSSAKKILIYLILIIILASTIMEYRGFDLGKWLSEKFGRGAVTCDDDLEVHFIDVGQGDCIFITAGGQNMLIDCGEASCFGDVAEYLNKLDVTHLDYVVGTHPHSDHMGGMSSVISSYDVGTVIIPHLDDSDIPDTRYFENFLDACDEKNLMLTEAQVGQVIALGDARAEIIAPCSDDYNGANNYSIGILLTHGNNDFLFTGDAEKLAENEMLESGKLHHVKVYKAGHHGSDTSSSQEFLNVISPDYAVVSCGVGNSYGHPHQVTLDKLEEYTRQIFRTDVNGSIVFESDGINLKIKTERNG